MNKQKKPLYYYYFIILLAILVMNTFVLPLFTSHVETVSYNQFMKVVEEQKIDQVEIGDTDITYTIKGEEKKIYQTETMEIDATLSDRLY